MAEPAIVSRSSTQGYVGIRDAPLESRLRQEVTERQFGFQPEHPKPVIARSVFLAGRVQYIAQVKQCFRRVRFNEQRILVLSSRFDEVTLVVIKQTQVMP